MRNVIDAWGKGQGFRFPLPIVAATATLIITACAPPLVTLQPAPRSFTGQDYEKVYKLWTRDAKEFQFTRLANILHVTATFEAWEFRWAYVTRYAADYSFNTADRKAMLQASLEDAKQFHRFYVTLVGENFRESDLTSQQSAWRVVLVDDRDRETLPVEIDKVARPTVVERTYFPSSTPFRFAFRIAFPVRRRDGSATIPSNARFTRMRIAGAAGSVELRWGFRRD